MSSNELPEITRNDLAEARRTFMEAAKNDPTQWVPGQSGNPDGRDPDPEDLLELFKTRLTIAKAKKVFDNIIMMAMGGNPDVPFHVQLSAANTVLDRMVGKPRQAPANEGEEDTMIVRVLRGLIEDDRALEGRTIRTGGQPVTLVEAEVREGTRK